MDLSLNVEKKPIHKFEIDMNWHGLSLQTSCHHHFYFYLILYTYSMGIKINVSVILLSNCTLEDLV
jgi:hypothetical protein